MLIVGQLAALNGEQTTEKRLMPPHGSVYHAPPRCDARVWSNGVVTVFLRMLTAGLGGVVQGVASAGVEQRAARRIAAAPQAAEDCGRRSQSARSQTARDCTCASRCVRSRGRCPEASEKGCCGLQLGGLAR